MSNKSLYISTSLSFEIRADRRVSTFQLYTFYFKVEAVRLFVKEIQFKLN